MHDGIPGPVIFFLSLFYVVRCDVYLHNPRGCNNRLNENTPGRANNNRLFDSQNNNKGGYNVGDELAYYAGSQLLIEWTNQHSCQTPNNNCDFILQYMCHETVRDGTTTQTIPDTQTKCKNNDCTKDKQYGMHEGYHHYQDCLSQQRNKGLFTADQKLKGDSSIYTRQNAAGTRRGYECPEERDYYPYWRPSPWIDIAVLTSNATRCSYYKKNSENVQGRFGCVMPRKLLQDIIKQKIVIPITQSACENFTFPRNSKNGASGVWTEFPSHNLDPPECQEAEFTRDNHLGDTIGGGSPTYLWTLPDLNDQRCVLRIRYNISTMDYDGWQPEVNSSVNRNIVPRVLKSLPENDVKELMEKGYRIQNNPQVKIFPFLDFKLQLIINTAQTGRVFQDRSYVFRVLRRPTSVPPSAKIHNLNVRGKRGNIVQVYPAVEYDFVPKDLIASKQDFIHIQWTGSNTNPKGNDGQGLAGTDRSNIVLLKNDTHPELSVFGARNRNYPALYTASNSFLGWPQSDIEKLAFLTKSENFKSLDAASPTFDLGLRQMNKCGEFHYMCTRNNAFSNREQKGRILVIDAEIATASIGWNGGKIAVGSSLIVVNPGVFSKLTKMHLEEWNLEHVKNNPQFNYLQREIIEDLASNILLLEPEGIITETKENFDIHLLLDSTLEEEDAHVIWTSSSDVSVWKRIEGKGTTDGRIVFEANRGGLYLLQRNTSGTHPAAIIIPVLLVVLVIGTFLYWKIQKPQCRTLKFMLGINPNSSTSQS